MNNITKKSQEKALQLLPNVLGEQRNYHFAFAYRRNKLLAVGQNAMTETNAKAHKFAKKYSITHWLNYPYIHAECAAIAKLWGKHHIDKAIKFVIIRLNSNKQLRNSKPCNNCQKLLAALGVTNVYYSTGQSASFARTP